ncbi:MAG: class I SAM-dependent methyltransferase [Candidatus Acididesulfobacter diazotrophicus]|jgi:ubiquinone/menaquinone biosynthesis C-methylase UbiE|uniref:Class I SAM-dependent methyltransferase n=1 Tax=Candidatus Acididesulfobacter diazotrophicus TaxID=2597226 RepID=A0A519BMB6_9DELT|nr:MAG: class I SAM-dependent methyltransferase [Candidatus Acididesulfobacter diazotrophicus]
MHKFNPANHKRLTSEERYQLMPPHLAIDEIKKIVDILHNNGEKKINIADIGCGSGFFTIPLLKTITDIKGINTKIYALDISEEMISCIKENIDGTDFSEFQKDCVILTKCGESRIALNDNLIDIVLISNVFHEIEQRLDYLHEIKRVLKSGGYLFLIDWDKEDKVLKMGPPAEERLSANETIELLNDAGFTDINIIPLYSSSFTIRCRK